MPWPAGPTHNIAILFLAVIGAALPERARAEFEWRSEAIGAGSAPSLQLDALGNPHVSYIRFLSGFHVAYATRIGGSWIIETASSETTEVTGMAALALDSAGAVHIAFSRDDLLFPSFRYGRRIGGAWTIETADATTSGLRHDLAIDAAGNAHVVYTADSLRYGRRVGGVWTREVAFPNPPGGLTYPPSLVLDDDGNPIVGYTNIQVRVASRSGGSWTIEQVPSNGTGEVSLQRDATGALHAAFNVVTGPSQGEVRYAWKQAGSWSVETAYAADSTLGGQRISLAIDEDGEPRIVFATTRRIGFEFEFDVKYAAKRGSAWTVESVGDAIGDHGSGSNAVSLVLWQGRHPRLVYQGSQILYVEREEPTSVGAPTPLAGALQIRPNPARRFADVLLRAPAAAFTEVAVFDVSGRRLATLFRGQMPAGDRALRWEGRDHAGRAVGPGTYFVRAMTGSSRGSARAAGSAAVPGTATARLVLIR
jgi:FlgD Ig-like domain